MGRDSQMIGKKLDRRAFTLEAQMTYPKLLLPRPRLVSCT
jgi:hypothetical protein